MFSNNQEDAIMDKAVLRFPSAKATVKLVLMVVLTVQLGSPLKAQSKQQPATMADTALARKLGADAYGMKRYVMAFLKAGPDRNQDSVTAANLQRAHMRNIQRMAREGRLVLAGPFLDDTGLQGIYVFNVESVEEARALTESDPAIKAGRLVMELHPWYGSAALQTVNDVHARIQSKSF
jgi:uncharacterized protein YciI